MVALRFLSVDCAFRLLVFLCITELSLQGCDDYMENYKAFVGDQCSPHHYIQLIQNCCDQKQSCILRNTLHEWCQQTEDEASHPCNVNHSCNFEYSDMCPKKSEPQRQPIELVSLQHFYCMMAKFKNMSNIAECNDTESVYICKPKSPETNPTLPCHTETTTPTPTKATTTATTAPTAGAAERPNSSTPQVSNQSVELPVLLLVLLIVVIVVLVVLLISTNLWRRPGSPWHLRVPTEPHRSDGSLTTL